MSLKEEVKLKYTKNSGLNKIKDLNKLNAPQNLINISIILCHEINKKNIKYRNQCWTIFLIPIGIILILLGHFVAPHPYKNVIIVFGILSLCVFSFYMCYNEMMWDKSLEQLIKKINEETKKVIKVKLNYKIYFSNSTLGTQKKKKILKNLSFKIIKTELDKFKLKKHQTIQKFSKSMKVKNNNIKKCDKLNQSCKKHLKIKQNSIISNVTTDKNSESQEIYNFTNSEDTKFPNKTKIINNSLSKKIDQNQDLKKDKKITAEKLNNYELENLKDSNITICEISNNSFEKEDNVNKNKNNQNQLIQNESKIVIDNNK